MRNKTFQRGFDRLSLGNYKIESILYDDTLTCSLTNNKEIGSFEVKVSQTNHGNIADCIEVIAQRFNRQIFLVHSSIFLDLVKRPSMMYYVVQPFERL